MKSTLIATLLLSSVAFAGEIKVINSPIEHIFVPKGFDSNDNIEVVVTGTFPNPCYSRNRVDVAIKDQTITLSMTALQRGEAESDQCAPMAIPFMEVANIGHLPQGKYEIVAMKEDKILKQETLLVTEPDTRNVDNHLYAIVDHVELGFTGGATGDALLIARTPSDCVEFDRVEYLSNGKDSLSILPIMKKVSTECGDVRKRIEIPIKFDLAKFETSQVLLFVRTIEGKSVNSFVAKPN